jgi:hypothetical protein
MAEKRPVVPIGPIVARRVFALLGSRRRKVVLTFGKPRAVPGWDWACPVSIKGLTGFRSTPRPVFGIDAFQSLELAMAYARATLWKAAPGLTWLDRAGDLGLPGSIPSYLPRRIQKRFEAEICRETLQFWRNERERRRVRRLSVKKRVRPTTRPTRSRPSRRTPSARRN